MATSPLQNYVENHMDQVEGWAGTKTSLLLLPTFLAVQEDVGGMGAFEIGVHHGRYLIALHNACAPGSQSVGLDLFGEQEHNVDGSGRGDIEVARRNVDAHCREPERVHLVTADSLTLDHGQLHDIEQRYGRFRIASVDGGHTPIHAATDIRTAARLTAVGGVIAVDDFFHQGFPGVTEGVYAVLSGREVAFVPWVVTRKKLFLAHISMVQRYRERLLDGLSELGHHPRTVSIDGHPCLALLV